MAQSNHMKNHKTNYGAGSSNGEAVVDINKYKNAGENKVSETYEMFDLSEIPGSRESFEVRDNPELANRPKKTETIGFSTTVRNTPNSEASASSVRHESVAHNESSVRQESATRHEPPVRYEAPEHSPRFAEPVISENADSSETAASVDHSAFEQVMAQMNIADQKTFERQYDKYWQQASLNGELLSMLICEVDFFESYHNHYGHQATAFMLLVVGLALKKVCEKHGCYLARYRGNGFAILIKGGDVESVGRIAEILRVAVECTQSEHKHSSIGDVVTLSIGTSSIYPMSKAGLFQNSEIALEGAKKGGYNQVHASVDIKNKQNGLGTSATELKKLNEPEKTEFERLMSEMEIFDRSDFNRHIVKTWKEASQDQELLSMVICELDFFSEFAQNHKKRTCDDILLIVACTLKSSCEKFDGFIARLEGAKFVALIKGGNATKGLKLAEALHASIQDLAMEHAHSPVKNSLTISLGLSNIFPSDENSMKTLLVNANNALTDAKSRGYDQIGVC